MAGKGYVFTKTSQMASIGVIFTSTYHTKQLNPWPNSSASRVVNYSQLSTCQGVMQPFKDELDTRGCLTSLRNKPQQKQPGQLSALIPGRIISQRVQLLFDGEKCLAVVCVEGCFSQIRSQIHIVTVKPTIKTALNRIISSHSMKPHIINQTRYDMI